MPDQEVGTIIHPLMMVRCEAIGPLTQAAELATSKETIHAIHDPLLDEWIMLARALLDVITQA